MSELREILDLLKRGIRAEKSCGIGTDNYVDDAIYDIKKWALGLLREEEERVAKWNEQYQAQKDGVKDVIFSIRKNIEEG